MIAWVYKHEIDLGPHEYQRLGDSPGDIVHVAVQNGIPYAWVEHRRGDPEYAPEVRVVLTGGLVRAGERHAGAFLLDGGAFVGRASVLVQGVQ